MPLTLPFTGLPSRRGLIDPAPILRVQYLPGYPIQLSDFLTTPGLWAEYTSFRHGVHTSATPSQGHWFYTALVCDNTSYTLITLLCASKMLSGAVLEIPHPVLASLLRDIYLRSCTVPKATNSPHTICTELVRNVWGYSAKDIDPCKGIFSDTFVHCCCW